MPSLNGNLWGRKSMRIQNAIRTVLASIALVASPAIALDPRFHITQYRHTAWRVQEGAEDHQPERIHA
ncbi:MAG TPA: hypothetical protein VMU19_04260 [Bryobacteraceae bacterium]|nr:hypothetical protein [Bryobacteraceae bacterium]